MKIGIDCHNLEGQRTGVGRYLWNLLKEWTNLSGSHPDRFVLYFKNEIPEDVLQDVLRLQQYSHDHENIVERWDYRVLRCKSNAVFKHWLLPRAATQDNIDVLFCPDYVLPVQQVQRSLDLLNFRWHGYKTAVTIHDIIYEARPKEYSWPSWADRVLLKWASKQSAKYADIIFVPSEFTKSEILKYYRVNHEKIVVTPLAPDPIFRKIPFTHDRERMVWSGIQQKYGIRDTYIFFAGSIFNRRFLPQKIKGFAMFTKDHPEFQFLIIGKNYTKPYQDIGALAATTNYEIGREAVIWREYASDEELVYLYNGAFATLWLSSYEGFGLPILESMACGTPVITSRSGSLPEVAGDSALYVGNSENPAEITSALVNLAIRKDFYNELSAGGFTRAEKFLWQSCAKTTFDKIQGL